jgi:low temperature requirement protein LtrA
MDTKPLNTWWGPPKNFSDRQNERKITWLELFYDLVYVAAIGQFTHNMAADLSWPVIGYSFLLFALVFWSWVNGSQYYDLHGSDGIRTRLFTLLQMLAVAAAAITINDAYAGYHKTFAIAFAVIEAIINYLWWSVGIWDPGHRKFSIYYTINYTMAFGLLVTSAFVNYNTATILWYLALLLNLTPGVTGGRAIVQELKQRGEVFSASAALVERFGSFTIIVLAESILAIVSGVAEVKDKEPASWLGFILGILITFLLWSIYFDMTSEQETKKGYVNLQLFVFLHYPLLASFGVVGACVRVMLEEMEGSQHNEVQWIFCVALASILFLIVAIAAIMRQEEENLSYIKPVSRLLIITGILILLIPFIGSYLNTVAFFGIITLLLSVPVFIGVRSWVKYKFFSKR